MKSRGVDKVRMALFPWSVLLPRMYSLAETSTMDLISFILPPPAPLLRDTG